MSDTFVFIADVRAVHGGSLADDRAAHGGSLADDRAAHVGSSADDRAQNKRAKYLAESRGMLMFNAVMYMSARSDPSSDVCWYAKEAAPCER
jgi:hypothetical protein